MTVFFNPGLIVRARRTTRKIHATMTAKSSFRNVPDQSNRIHRCSLWILPMESHHWCSRWPSVGSPIGPSNWFCIHSWTPCIQVMPPSDQLRPVGDSTRSYSSEWFYLILVALAHRVQSIRLVGPLIDPSIEPFQDSPSALLVVLPT